MNSSHQWFSVDVCFTCLWLRDQRSRDAWYTFSQLDQPTPLYFNIGLTSSTSSLGPWLYLSVDWLEWPCTYQHILHQLIQYQSLHLIHSCILHCVYHYFCPSLFIISSCAQHHSVYCWFCWSLYLNSKVKMISLIFYCLATCPVDSSLAPESAKHFTQPAPETGKHKLHVTYNINLYASQWLLVVTLCKHC